MSDFMPRDLLPDLWEEILQRHWNYLDTEEGMQKLEERKKLEACFKEFLSIVPHDRKFFLPETAHVLKKSIKEMDDFSAYKAMIGFESISQYASNLFTKPWRKEYRYIKMYSGFYAHDISANLVDADKLFEAMGYKQLPDQTLMLDGPICPDQVTNVSRDAMAAYVECQIMKHIFLGVTASELSCSWQDIFNFRETHIGGASQAIRAMTYAIHERRYKKEKVNMENTFITGMQQSQPPPPQIVPQCGLCAHGCRTSSQMPHAANTCNHHTLQSQPAQLTPNTPFTGMCSIHSQPSQNIYMQNAVVGPPPAGSHHYKGPAYGPPQIPHSKSLEHYGEHAGTGPGALPQRHSFDQPYDNASRSQYEGVYDCVDGYQSCNFNAYNHPYNRYPLPYNISNQLNNHFPTQCTGMNAVNQYGLPPMPAGPAMVVPCNHKAVAGEPGSYYGKMQPDQMYGDCNGYMKKPQEVCNHHGNGSVKDLSAARQYEYATNGRQSDHLIDFEDRPSEVQYNRVLNNFDNFDQQPSNRSYKLKQSHPNYDVARSHLNQTSKDLYGRHYDDPDEIVANNSLYGTRHSDRKSALRKSSDKYSRNAEILDQYENVIDNKESSRPRDFVSYHDTGECDDRIMNGGSGEMPRIHNKDHDGVGSFESWDYVFQNLEKHGYSKDLGDRGDLLMRGLDLDSMNIGSATEKRRSRNMDMQKRSSVNDPSITTTLKSKTLEKTDMVKELVNQKPKNMERPMQKQDNDITVQKLNVTKVAQVQKSSSVVPTTPAVQKAKTTKLSTGNTEERQSNGYGGGVTTAIGGSGSAAGPTTVRRVSHRANIPVTNAATMATKSDSNQQPASSTSTTLVSNSTEWSCRFCTFLNPDTKRICEMCCRSKDFILDASNTPTCV